MEDQAATEANQKKKEPVIGYGDVACLFGCLGEDALWEIRNEEVPYKVEADKEGISSLTFETQRSSPMALYLRKSVEETREVGALIESGLKKLSREQIKEFCKAGKLLGKLVGCSVSTILALVGNDDLVVDCGGPTDDGKYVGWITFGPEKYYRPLVNSQPVYDSPEAAKFAMSGVLNAAQALVCEIDYNVLSLLSPVIARWARENPNRRAEIIDVAAQEPKALAFLS